VLSTPLAIAGHTIGALNLYSRGAEVFQDPDIEAAQLFANRAAVVLANATAYANTESTNQHLQVALEHARVIGRAQGVIMVRQNCDSEAAFDVLRRASQRTNRKLSEIAEEIAEPFDREATSDSAS
jgi:GAF domain-containing protein